MYSYPLIQPPALELINLVIFVTIINYYAFDYGLIGMIQQPACVITSLLMVLCWH